MSIFATLSTVLGLVKSHADVDKVKDIVTDTILDATGNKPMDLYKANGNIVKLVNSLSVEPIIITTEAARRSPAYKSSVNMMLDIFSGYYLQAFHNCHR